MKCVKKDWNEFTFDINIKMYENSFLNTTIGDLSPDDKIILREVAKCSSRIIEFGVGASTQILAHYTEGDIVSYDTSKEWIDKTIENFYKVGVDGNCKFELLYVNNITEISGKFDCVFSDGRWEYRQNFSLHTWNLLVPGGVLIMHDGRRDKDIINVENFISKKYREIERVDFNPGNSSMVLFYKRDKRSDKIDWHKNMTKEQLGIDWKFNKNI